MWQVIIPALAIPISILVGIFGFKLIEKPLYLIIATICISAIICVIFYSFFPGFWEYKKTKLIHKNNDETINNQNNGSGGIILRMLILVILSLIYILCVPILIEQDWFSLHFPDSRQRSFIIILYCFASISIINYVLSHVGKNMIDGITEICLILIFFLLIIAFLGPNLFIITTGKEERFLRKPIIHVRNMTELRMLTVLIIPLILFVIYRIRNYFRKINLITQQNKPV